MGKAGVFAPDARLELIEGEIYEMAPIHPPHAGAVNLLTRLLVLQTGNDAVVSVQNPVIAGPLSVPQPDLAVMKPRADGYSRAHPQPRDVLLVIEVADTTLASDLRIKMPLYARAGIREAWVVDVNAQAIHVFREAAPAGYRLKSVATGDEELTLLERPQVRVRVAEVFQK